VRISQLEDRGRLLVGAPDLHDGDRIAQRGCNLLVDLVLPDLRIGVVEVDRTLVRMQGVDKLYQTGVMRLRQIVHNKLVGTVLVDEEVVS